MKDYTLSCTLSQCGFSLSNVTRCIFCRRWSHQPCYGSHSRVFLVEWDNSCHSHPNPRPLGEHSRRSLPLFPSPRVLRADPKWHNPISQFKVPVWPPSTTSGWWLIDALNLITIAESEKCVLLDADHCQTFASQRGLDPVVRQSEAQRRVVHSTASSLFTS